MTLEDFNKENALDRWYAQLRRDGVIKTVPHA